MIGRNDLCWCGSGKKYKKCHLGQDFKKKTFNKSPRDILSNCKSSEDIEKMRIAGIFNGELLDYVRSFITEGLSTEEIDRRVHEYTLDHGHIPATLGYNGFPKSCCTSRNNVVCHGIPSNNEYIKSGDIINVDLTTIVNGFFADSSETFCIGEVSEGARFLVETTALALLRAIDAVVPGKPLSVVAEAIEPFVISRGCSVVRQYTGHGIGKAFHETYSVYHHREKGNESIILKPGMTFTIEPMINAGSYRVVTDKVDNWTVRTKDGSLSAQFEHTIVVTESSCDVLTLTPQQKKQGKRLIVDGLDLPA